MSRSILLLSGSNVFGSGYLDPFEEIIKDFLEGTSKLIFVPYAAAESNWDAYTKKVRDRFVHFGIKVEGLHEPSNRHLLPQDCESLFIGGGNTFRLLYNLQQFNLLDSIKNAVMNNNVRYIGSSAGSNVACKSICTTNDMPIIYPLKGFDAINLLPIQVNPHYIDPDPNSRHMGETREDRIREFHENNSTPVIGLREGAWLRADDEYFGNKKLHLGGVNGAKIFFKGKQPFDIPSARKIILSQEEMNEAGI